MSAEFKSLGVRPALSHWSETPLERIAAGVNDKFDRATPLMKPNGLWVSIDDDGDYGWKAWCADNTFNLDCFVWQNKITLRDPDSFLWLTSVNDLLEFQTKYGEEHSWRDIRINWGRVSAEYPGIMIAPYQWSTRLEMMWYYVWDCASGCIWSPDLVASIEPVRAQD